MIKGRDTLSKMKDHELKMRLDPVRVDAIRDNSGYNQEIPRLTILGMHLLNLAEFPTLSSLYEATGEEFMIRGSCY